MKARAPALFLDRDGVVNVDTNYLYRIEDVVFIEGIFDLVGAYRERGFKVIIVTNQSGIARGRYSEADFAVLTEWMQTEFALRGAPIDAVYHCPHHPSVTGPCSCRKPEPGMLLRAAQEHDVDLAHSVMVGDKERDILAAKRAGVPTTYLFDRHPEATEATRVIASLKELM